MGKNIVKFRYVFLAVFIVLVVVSVILLPKMINSVNYDLTSYLPDDYETSKGYEFLSETFNIHGDVEIGVTATRAEIKQAADEITGLNGVTSAIWAQYMEMAARPRSLLPRGRRVSQNVQHLHRRLG